jgi:AAA family ATP:ADP antiporter
VPAVYLLAAALLVGFWAAHAASEGTARALVGYAFYVFVSVLAVFATAVFWGLMADGHSDEKARRLFGLIAVGGTLGALGGSALAGALNQILAPRDLILAGAGFYATAVFFVAPLTRRLGGTEAALGGPVPRVGLGAALEGMRLFASSRYLWLIGLFLAGQTLAGTFLYIESRAYTAEVFPTRGLEEAVAAANRTARADFFATIDFAYNAIALGVQLFLVGRLVRWIGIGAMLASLPLVNLAGFAMLAAGPSLLAYGIFEVLQRGSRFAVMKPAREMLFTVLSRDEKYKAKQFLDTAVYRSTDAAWAWIDELIRGLLGPLVLKLAVLVPACAAWTGVGLALGRLNARRRAAARD